MLTLVRIGIIGAGVSGRLHVDAYCNLKNVEVTAIADSSKRKAEQLAKLVSLKKGNSVHAYGSYEELICESNVDAVSVCTPPYTHANITVAALKRGLHVLCEKPISVTVQEAEIMIDWAKKSNRILMIGHCLRFKPGLRAIKDTIANCQIGKVLYLHSSRFGWHHIWRGWKTRLDKGGSHLLEDGIHSIDIVRFLLNSDILRVRAFSEFPGSYDEYTVFLHLENGTKAVVSDVWNVFSEWKHHLVICGDSGTIETGDPDEFITIWDQNIKSTTKKFDASMKWKTMYIDQSKAFINSIIRHKKPLVTPADGLAALLGVIAAKKSIDMKKEVNIQNLRNLYWQNKNG